MTSTTNNLQNNKSDTSFGSRNFNFKPLQIKHKSRNASEPCILTVVNTSKNGKRVVIAPELIERIGSPEKVVVAFDEGGIAFSNEFSDPGSALPLRKTGSKLCIYSAELVETITETYNLDFSKITSVSFQDVMYVDLDNENVAAFVTLTESDSNLSSDEEGEHEEIAPLE